MNNTCKLKTLGTVGFLWLVLLFAGCSQEELGQETDEYAIAFDCSSTQLRASETTIDNMQYFRVSAVWNKGDNSYESFMDNQLVEKWNNSWVYSPVKHWPAYGRVSFFAYSPASSSGMETESVLLDSATNQLSFRYKVSTDYQEQEDFMVASNLNKTKNPVQLTFTHALSIARFKIRSKDTNTRVLIKNIQLNKLYSKGRLIGTANGSTSNWGWDLDTSSQEEYLVTPQYPFEAENVTYREVGSLMVLPQTPADNNTEIIILYDIVGGAVNQTETLQFDTDFVFKMGRSYTFYLELK